MIDPAATPKIDLTDPAAFAYWTRDTVRFSDMDRYRHVNNVAVATYCETGRVEFAEKLMPGSTSGEGTGWVILRLTVNYMAQAHYPGHVDIGTRVDRVGRSSCAIGQGLFKDGVCFATSEAILVWLDLAGGGGPAPIPDELRARMLADMTEPRMSAPAPSPSG
jgi:acyl-CoA thioester hydrolase